MFGSGKKEVKTSGKSDQINGILDKGCNFEGKLTFDGTVRINGDFKGEIYSDGTLVVGNDAHVKAKVYASTLIIYGKIEGELKAKERIEMHVPAVVVGNVGTKSLSIEDGVIFEGKCHMEHGSIETAQSDYNIPADTGDLEEEVLVM